MGVGEMRNGQAYYYPQGGSASPAPGAVPPAPGPTPEQQAQNAQRDALYQQLLGRATQSLTIDQNDPNIRQQADAYSANIERQKRNYLADLAEKSGGLANLQGQTRIAAEQAGQASGQFESQLIGREIDSRRQEIQDALQQMGGMLTSQQQMALQQQLAQMDDATKRLGLEYQNSQFGAQLGQNANQFAQQMGFNYENMDNGILRLLLGGVMS
jgi:hypothetical protein